MCKMLIDSSIILSMENNSLIGRAIYMFLDTVSEKCRILYSSASVEELKILGIDTDNLKAYGIASRSSVSIKELRKTASRYGKTIKRIGIHDVMIALNAVKENAFLTTGDWEQGRFYMNISGEKPVYIPIKRIAIKMGEL